MNIFNYNKTNISKRLINSINAVTKHIGREYFCFSEESINTIIDYANLYNKKSILVIDDAGLQIVNKLLTKSNLDITLTFYTGDNDSIFDHIVYFIKDVYKNININFVKFKDINTMKFDLIIANPPYGKIGANITKKIIDTVEFKEYVNLEPGNDYFFSNNIYRYIDTDSTPNICPNAFSDAAVTPALTKIQRVENNFTEVDARCLLQIRHNDKEVKSAIIDYLHHVCENKTIFNGGRCGSKLVYDDTIFTQNSGGFDVIHGYLAVANGKDWTYSTRYNIFKEDYKDGADYPNCPIAKIKGCLQFKKLVYSELGLKFIKLIYSSSPEGWCRWADIDYSDCLTWNDVFTKLNVSEENQKILIEAAEKFELNDKEKEICKIVKEIL